jgi:myo-inositol 2-dehydrogenase/D-chiro-inositol 1-dehydrogenase
MEPVRIAVVGVGRMGTFHARTLATLDTIDVVAVADTAADAARSVGEEIGVRHYTSLRDLLADGDVEAWLVATSTPSHPAVVRRALDGGIHVLCEKPLALEPAESEALGVLAAESELLLQVGFWRRFAPPWVAAKRLLDAGAIGRPLMLRLAQWDADPPPASFCDPAISGGLAVDCGVHEFDLVEWLTGLTVDAVTARNLPLVDQSIGVVGDVDNLLAVVDLAGGAVATVDLSRNCRYGDDVRTEILGDSGAIFVDLLPVGRTRLATAAGIEVVAGSATPDAFAAGVAAQAESFAAAVRGQRVDVPGAAASSRAVALGRAAQRAAETGAAVTATL